MSMVETRTQFGLPNTLPPPGRRDLWSCFVFAGMGLFVLLLGLFPQLRPPPQLAIWLALGWLAFPVWGLFKFIVRTPRAAAMAPEQPMHGTTTQVGLFAAMMIGVGVGYYFWATHLGIPSPVVLGSLLILEGVGGGIVGLTEWRRFSHLGIASGLVAGGFLLPFVGTMSAAVPVGASFLAGSLVSAGILSWQLRQQRASYR